MGMSPLQVILFLLGFGSILFLTYVTTRYIAGKSNRALKGRHIQIVETVSLGLDKRIHLVKVGDRHILISSTSKHIEFLSSVNIEEAEEKKSGGPGFQNIFNFKELFEKYTSAYRKKNESSSENISLSDETEMRSFRANLGRLRSIVHRTDQAEKDGDDDTNEK